ncbi:MAG TPA: serine hydrolase [Vicinamibacterales bacterium]
MFRSRPQVVLRLCATLAALLFAAPLVPTAESAPAAEQKKGASNGTTTRKASTKRTATKARKASPKKRYSASRSRARRARLARARAAAYARELKELQTPRFKVTPTGERVPDLRAEAAIAYNPVTHEILWESNANSPRSIASITKVMTAIVFLEHAIDLDQKVRIEPSDVRNASTTYLRARDEVTTRDLLNLLLIGSDNAAARALARVSPFGSEGFVDRMNRKAQELGLEHTHYADPSGLLETNVSSAYDMARLISFAAGDDRIASIMRKSEETIRTDRRTVKVRNTNKLVGGDVDVRGGKTGFIRKAGYCLATLLQLPQGEPVAVVILGARSNASRFWETRHLFNWLSERTRGLLTAEATPVGAEAQPH